MPIQNKAIELSSASRAKGGVLMRLGSLSKPDGLPETLLIDLFRSG